MATPSGGTISDGDRAIILALELMREKIVMLPLAIAQNAALAAADASRGPDRKPAPQRNWLDRNIGRAADAAGLLASRFGALLGPMATFGTFLNAPTSGLSVFTGAMRLFASAVAPVLLPTLFSLSVGLATTSDVVFKKLVPALDGFSKFVLQTGIPAVAQMAETAGRAAETLRLLADSKVGRALGASDGAGGSFGALNRTLDRAGAFVGLSESPDKGRHTSGAIEAGLDDIARLVPGGERLVGAKDFAKRNVPEWLGGDPTAGLTGANRGMSAESLAATDRARLDTLRELQLSMMPRAQVGNGAAGIWKRAAQAAVGMSPYERRQLEMMQQVITIMTRSVNDAGSETGTMTEGFGAFIRGALADAAIEGSRRGRR